MGTGRVTGTRPGARGESRLNMVIPVTYAPRGVGTCGPHVRRPFIYLFTVDMNPDTHAPAHGYPREDARSPTNGNETGGASQANTAYSTCLHAAKGEGKG